MKRKGTREEKYFKNVRGKAMDRWIQHENDAEGQKER